MARAQIIIDDIDGGVTVEFKAETENMESASPAEVIGYAAARNLVENIEKANALLSALDQNAQTAGPLN